MRKWKGRECFALVCCLCIWAMMAFYFFPHASWQEEAASVQEAQEREERDLVALENFMNAHRDLDAFSQETAKHQSLSMRAMPEELEQGAFLEFLQRLAIGNQMELLGVIPGKSVQEKDVLALPVQVKLSCNYYQLLDFLKGLQDGERFLQIRNARIHSEDGRLLCQLDLAIFAMKELEASNP